MRSASEPPPLPEWLVFLLADTSLLQAVFWSVAIGGLIAILIKLWPSIRNLVKIVDAVAGLPQFIERTDDSIGALRRQVENDHDAEPVMREEITTAKTNAEEAKNIAAEVNMKFDEVLAWQEHHDRERAAIRYEKEQGHEE